MFVMYQYYKINNDSLPKLLPFSSNPPCSLHHYSPSSTGVRLPRWLSGEGSACQCRRCRRCGFDPWVRKIPWKKKWQPTPVLLPGKSHGQRNLAGYSPSGCKESDTTEQLSLHSIVCVYIYTHIYMYHIFFMH